MFLFYALPAVPFMILGLTLAAGSLLGRARTTLLRRRWAAAAVGAFALLVVANFFYLYPILAAKVIPQSEWHDRMWFRQCTSASSDHTVEVAPCWI
jgi:dolichyl-phosphate-mannose--protein O-mannosyl transferase